MNRINKPKTSEVVKKKIKYKIGGDNSILREILIKEQKQVCAYSQVRFIAAMADDVEHFDPNLKDTVKDNYNNWFAVSHKLNIKKGSIERWNKYQPILPPTASDFEERIKYDNGEYRWSDGDVEAKNLCEYLNINQENLVYDRKEHIRGLKFVLKELDNDLNKLRSYLDEINPNQKQYLRAIEAELGIKF